MRILAIIPACEGSVTLPNKNMRIVHGKPMIYYVINNALQSHYVTNVIVTTNSKDIITLANHMGVITRERDSSLSKSTVSLDKVVWDVFNQLDISDYDVVVTMQSISPTLKVSSLDAAFDIFFSNNYDSLISVKNQQHFYWYKQGNALIPIQGIRMNRHQLPPFYVETGAFLITKSCYIKENTRLGDRIGIFELFGDEALDVDSFGDLKQVENAMSRQSTAIFVNGNHDIGLGHISRILQIADELFTKPDIYFDEAQTSREFFGLTTYSVIPVYGQDGFIKAVSEKQYDIIINDILNTDASYMKMLRDASKDSRIINFEDEGEGTKYADVVINALYEKETGSNTICGNKYFVLSKLFLVYDPISIRNKVRDVIVTFGGADPQNYSERILDIAKLPGNKNINFHVIFGRANGTYNRLKSFNKYDNIEILHDIDNMAELMSRCDIAISSRGRTCFELAAMGIPTISIAQHEREEMHEFVCKENGFICLPAGTNDNVIKETVEIMLNSSKEKRINMQQKMLSHDLRNGRKNVAKIIRGE